VARILLRTTTAISKDGRSGPKGSGIDVIAVGNGEAAVRKISDVRPDLVWPNVFMAVRNATKFAST